MNAPIALRHFGPADNAQFYNHWLDVNPMFVGLCMTNLGIPPLSGHFDHDLVCTMTYLAGVGKAFTLGRTVNSTDVYVYTMGELLAPMVDETIILNENASREALVKQVNGLISNANLGTYTSATQITFAAAITGQSNTVMAGSKATDWPVNNICLTPEAAVRVLYYVAAVCQPIMRKTGTTLLVHCYVSVLKRGTVSTSFLTKIADGVQADLNKPVTIVEDVLPLFYRTFGQWINQDNIQQVTNDWKTKLPVHALRLSLTVIQAAGGGLTSYITIGRALRLYNDFSWGKIRLYFPTDWTNFEAALQVVGHNAWYGFRKDLGPARSTMYKNLAYVAKELHVRAGGEIALNRYGGWPRRVAHMDAIDLLIATYVQNRDADHTDEAVNDSNDEATVTIEACTDQVYATIFS